MRKKRTKQTGTSDRRRDRYYRAKHPGWRISASGRRYYENRKNRSDRDRRKRL